MSFVGGKLKLKGGKDLPGKAGVKKKKRKQQIKESPAELALAEQAAASGEQGEGQDALAGQGGDGGEGAPAEPADKRTAAEKRFEEHAARHELARLKKAASKSHRERIAEMNEKLANLTEHHDFLYGIVALPAGSNSLLLVQLSGGLWCPACCPATPCCTRITLIHTFKLHRVAKGQQ